MIPPSEVADDSLLFQTPKSTRELRAMLKKIPGSSKGDRRTSRHLINKVLKSFDMINMALATEIERKDLLNNQFDDKLQSKNKEEKGVITQPK